jgi:hypothetical protein
MGGREQLRGRGGLPLRGGLTHRGMYMPTVLCRVVITGKPQAAALSRWVWHEKSVDATHPAFLIPRAHSGAEEK